MSLFTNKKFETLLKTYVALKDAKKEEVEHDKLPVDELFRSIRDSIKSIKGAAPEVLVPYPLRLARIDDSSVMDLSSNGFSSNPATWDVIEPGTACCGMLVLVIDDNEEIHQGNVKNSAVGTDIEVEPQNTTLFWITEDYERLVVSNLDHEYTEYLIGAKGVSTAFTGDNPSVALSFEQVVQIVKLTMLYQAAVTCRIAKEDDHVYKYYNRSR